MPYTQQAKNAYAAIKAAGILLTFTQTADAYNSSTQTVAHIPTVYQLWCIVSKPMKKAGLGESYAEDGSTVDYQQSLIAAAYGTTVVPRVGDTLILAGNKWTIIMKGNLQPDEGPSILYRLSIRRG